MNFEMSTNIAVQTTEPEKAIEFYTSVLGFNDRSAETDFGGLEANPFRIFVQNEKRISGPVLELFVDNLEVAKQHLVENGCTVICWEGLGKDCYIKDPFGLTFNIWQKLPSK